jgi:hypothetical protein
MPPPRILVGEFDKPRHDAIPALDGVHRQTTCEHLCSPSIDHRVGIMTNFATCAQPDLLVDEAGGGRFADRRDPCCVRP